jgi:ribosomal protein L24
MPKMKIKKGDNVVVIAGRDKGKRGDVAVGLEEGARR